MGLLPQTLFAMQAMDEAYKECTAKELIITSANDARHSATSLHYSGAAFDCRTTSAGISTEDQEKIKAVFKDKVGHSTDFDCVIESDHIHVEYQPKRRG